MLTKIFNLNAGLIVIKIIITITGLVLLYFQINYIWSVFRISQSISENAVTNNTTSLNMDQYYNIIDRITK